MVDVKADAGATGETGASDDIHAVPDVELLQFQKQRSTPKVRLSEVNMDTGEEILHAEVDDFGKVAGDKHMGLAKSGTEENVVRMLHKAGSLDASDILQDLDPSDTGKAAATGQEEEKKE